MRAKFRYSKIKSLATYSTQTGDYGTITVDIGEALEVVDIKFGFYDPIRIICKTEKGQIGFIATAYSWTNQYYDKWSDMRPWEFDFFEVYPKGDEWNANVWDYIKRGDIRLGMTKEQVLISWRKPGRIIKNRSGKKNVEQWIYISKILHFVEDILRSIHHRKYNSTLSDY